MQLSGQLGIFVILIIISVDALLESSVLSALSSITPFTLQPSLIGSFLTGIISGAPELTPQCYICDVIATLSPMASCTRRGSCLVETAKLVNFYCVKANTNDVFLADFNDPSVNNMDSFDVQSPFAFLIHGFTDYYPGAVPIDGIAWQKLTIANWAKQGVNVCAVNWGLLSKEMINYFVASQINTSRVASYLVEILIRLESLGMNLLDATLAGHSLGAQIAGKVGGELRQRNKTLGTIFGLDPAGPCFTHPCKINEAMRLDASDANHVQCIHTNIGGLGQIPRCGCHDFYLNYGVYQPGAYTIIGAHIFVCHIFNWALRKENQCRSKEDGPQLGIHTERKCELFRCIQMEGHLFALKVK